MCASDTPRSIEAPSASNARDEHRLKCEAELAVLDRRLETELMEAYVAAAATTHNGPEFSRKSAILKWVTDRLKADLDDYKRRCGEPPKR